MEFIYRIRDKFVSEPLPPAGFFDGQTVVITGATAGLGFAAAIHFVNLGARVVITCRDARRGESARLKIEAKCGIQGQSRVEVMELNMNSYASCCNFVEELKNRNADGRESNRVDSVVLNAGCSNPHYAQSPEGWEETLQVNALSTILLGLLLLPWMKTQTIESTPHLVVVASRDHLDPDITEWSEWIDEDGGILRHLNSNEWWPSGETLYPPNYANSKLVLMYGMDEINRLALGANGDPLVIVNSVCPGIVATDLARNISSQSLMANMAVRLYFAIGKSADYGARIYISGAHTSKKDHGKFLISLYTDEQYRVRAIPNLKSNLGKRICERVCKEIREEFASKGLRVPDVS